MIGWCGRSNGCCSEPYRNKLGSTTGNPNFLQEASLYNYIVHTSRTYTALENFFCI